jgi:glycosyltransferase involved in cell wall biosynthesis
MDVSIIIPTYNRSNELKDTLESLLIQSSLPSEVIIVDDSDNNIIEQFILEKTPLFLEKRITLKYIRNFRQKSLTISRNTGVDSANGDIILFLDDDVILKRNYLSEILLVFRNMPQAIGVQGFICNFPRISGMKNAINILLYMGHQEKNRARVLPSGANTYPSKPEAIIPCEWLSGSNHALKKEIFQEFRYDENLKRYSFKEDVDLTFRIYKRYPHSLYMTPFAQLEHRQSSLCRMPVRRMVLMEYCYNFYFFYKNIDQTFINTAIFYWSVLAYFIGALPGAAVKVLFGSNDMMVRLHYSAYALFISIKNVGKLKRGDLTFLDSLLFN